MRRGSKHTNKTQQLTKTNKQKTELRGVVKENNNQAGHASTRFDISER